MTSWGKYVGAALLVAALAHFAAINAVPGMRMRVAIERVSQEGGFNQWRVAPRVTPQSRAIVRPSPDFAYSTCAYDLSNGPVSIRVAPWDGYWSLSLYAANSDNFHVVNDREARRGAAIVLVRRRARAPEDGATYVESPSTRGIALIRRLAPTLDAYNAAARAGEGDVCAPLRG